MFLIDAVDGIFPSVNPRKGNDLSDEERVALEEERRLCYVAMTRAKEKLTLTNCRQRMLYGRTSANRASRFLEEIPEENMRWESKPEPRFGGMEHDGTFGGDRYEDGWGSSPARAGGAWSSGGVHSYRAPAQAPQRPLASVQQASSTRKNAAPAAPLLQLQQGDMVEHTAFGKGMVLSVRPMGGDALAEVAFEGGTKKLMLKASRKASEKTVKPSVKQIFLPNSSKPSPEARKPPGTVRISLKFWAAWRGDGHRSGSSHGCRRSALPSVHREGAATASCPGLCRGC